MIKEIDYALLFHLWKSDGAFSAPLQGYFFSSTLSPTEMPQGPAMSIKWSNKKKQRTNQLRICN
jgi:hypothetical protein